MKTEKDTVIDEITSLVDRLVNNTEFVKKLKRKTWWTKKHCLYVIEEYKKFLVISFLQYGDITPPKDIDEVWHLHLTYTDSYWEELCSILGFKLHHRPTGGLGLKTHIVNKGSIELEIEYEQTLKNYYKTFGYLPPDNVWNTKDYYPFAKQECYKPISNPPSDFDNSVSEDEVLSAIDRHSDNSRCQFEALPTAFQRSVLDKIKADRQKAIESNIPIIITATQQSDVVTVPIPPPHHHHNSDHQQTSPSHHSSHDSTPSSYHSCSSGHSGHSGHSCGGGH